MRKLILLFLLALAATLGLVILLRRNLGASPMIFNIFADAALGVVMGLGSRMVLRRRSWVLRAIVSAAFAVLALVVLGQLTAGESGIGPIRLHRVQLGALGQPGIVLPLPSPLGVGDQLLQDLAHMILAVSISWIALRAWNGGRRASVAPRRHDGAWSHAKAPAKPLLAAPARVRAPAKPSLVVEAHVKEPAKPLSVAVPAPKAQPMPRIQPGPRLTVRHVRSRKAATAPSPIGVPRTRIARPARAARRWRTFQLRRRGVRLAAYEEHRCPYCLEAVRRNDPRGTVECPVCHTLHHKDCWDVTGTCQVPHLSV